MMRSSSVHSVVVGIDASANAQEALDWAATEAAMRGVPLRIAHAWNLAAHPAPRADGVDFTKAMIQASEELLARAAGRVKEQRSGLQVDIDVLSEEAVPGLIRLGEQAAMVVVGSRGLSRFTSILIGSVSQGLVAHAPCPVVVFRGGQTDAAPAAPAAGVAPTVGSGAVVLGAAPGEDPAPIEFAFAEADRRGVPLLAFRTWDYPPSYYGGYAVMATDDLPQRIAAERGELLEVLATARKTHPDVEFFQEVAAGDSASELVHASASSCLTVVGADRHRNRFAMPIGRVAQQVLHHAHGPVAVVPHGHR